MKKNDFQVLIRTTMQTMLDLTATKGEEYANSNADQHANFKRLAEEMGINPEQVLNVYLSKHLDGIKSFIRTNKVYSEPVEGRIDDAILYLILLKGLLVDREKVRQDEEMGILLCGDDKG